jgi:hypothetical protein
LLISNGSATFDDFGVRTNDAAFEQPASLLASAAPTVTSAAASGLTAEALEADIEQIKASWLANGQLNAAQVAFLDNVKFEIVDLPGLTLGQAIGDTVYLDVNAAGFGWFVDAAGTTPGDRIDLLTVVAHEVGHWLGFEHDDAQGESPTLMSATLAAGARLVTLGSGDGKTSVENDPAYQRPEASMASDAPTLSLRAEQALGDASLGEAMDIAKAHWEATDSLDSGMLSHLSQVTFRIADLPAEMLGKPFGVVNLDVSAAGFGWLADVGGRPDGGSVDVLSMDVHENDDWLASQGDDTDAGSPTLTSATLAAGARLVTQGSQEAKTSVIRAASDDYRASAADAAAGEADLPRGTASLMVVTEEALLSAGQPLLRRSTPAVPEASQTERTLDRRFIPVSAAPAEELRVFDPATGELLTYEMGAGEAADAASAGSSLARASKALVGQRPAPTTRGPLFLDIEETLSGSTPRSAVDDVAEDQGAGTTRLAQAGAVGAVLRLIERARESLAGKVAGDGRDQRDGRND